MTLWKHGLGSLAVISLAACIGGDGSGPPADGGMGTIEPEIEVPAEDVSKRILDNADIVMLSALDFGSPTLATAPVRADTDCSSTTCRLSHPLLGSGKVDLDTAREISATGTMIADKGGVQIVRASSADAELLGVNISITPHGAWLDHSYFGLLRAEDFQVFGQSGILSGLLSFGDSTGSALSGSASWHGAMIGTDIEPGATFGTHVVGEASLSANSLENPKLDITLSEIVELGTNKSRADLSWENLSISDSGTFSGSANGTIKGVFYGVDHAEVGGLFERASISGAFGARKQ